MEAEELIRKARELPYTRWWEITYMIDETQDERVKERLKMIMTYKRLLEERRV